MNIILNNFKKKNINDKIKGVIYGKGFENKKVEFRKNQMYYNKLKKNLIVTVKIIDKKYKVLIKNIEKHPYKKKITHVDFFLINE